MKQDHSLSQSQPVLPSNGHPQAAPSAAHTPGPWEIGERAWSYVHVEFDGGGHNYTVVSDNRDCPVAFAPGDTDDDAAANAHLIAAAPDLLEALKSFAVYTVEDDIGAIYFSVNGQRAWVSIGSNIAPILLQLDAIQRAAIAKVVSQ